MVIHANFCAYTKNHETVHFKWVNYISCGLYFNKADKNKAKATIRLNDATVNTCLSILKTRQRFLFSAPV